MANNEKQGKTKKPIFKKWWFWVIVIVVVIAAAASNSGDGGDSSKSDGNAVTGTGNKATTEEKTVYEPVDLQSMLDALSDNAMKAEQTYQDKYVEITGKISAFDSDGGYISIEPVGADEWNFETVMCNVKGDEQKQFLMNRSKGDTVVIKGKVTSIGELLGYTVNIDEIS